MRAFSDQEFPPGVLEDCLLAAGNAPSGVNIQHWHSAVVHSAKGKRTILGWSPEEKPFLLLVIRYPAGGCKVPDIQKVPLGEITSFH